MMPKKPQHGGKAPSMDQPDPRPPMDTEALSAEAGGAPAMPPPGAGGMEDPMMAALMGGAPAGVPPSAADPMTAALMGGGAPPPGAGAPPPGMAPEMMGAGEPEMGGDEQMLQIGQQFGPVVAAAMLVSPEVKQTLTEIIGQILAGQAGGPPAGGAPPPPMAGGMPPGMPPGVM